MIGAVRVVDASKDGRVDAKELGEALSSSLQPQVGLRQGLSALHEKIVVRGVRIVAATVAGAHAFGVVRRRSLQQQREAAPRMLLVLQQLFERRASLLLVLGQA